VVVVVLLLLLLLLLGGSSSALLPARRRCWRALLCLAGAAAAAPACGADLGGLRRGLLGRRRCGCRCCRAAHGPAAVIPKRRVQLLLDLGVDVAGEQPPHCRALQVEGHHGHLQGVGT
jgi:hypothetical protein